jgi:hypothetical protein
VRPTGCRIELIWAASKAELDRAHDQNRCESHSLDDGSLIAQNQVSAFRLATESARLCSITSGGNANRERFQKTRVARFFDS